MARPVQSLPARITQYFTTGPIEEVNVVFGIVKGIVADRQPAPAPSASKKGRPTGSKNKAKQSVADLPIVPSTVA